METPLDRLGRQMTRALAVTTISVGLLVAVLAGPQLLSVARAGGTFFFDEVEGPPPFSASTWKTARAGGSTDVLESQATEAVREGTLLGRDRAEVRRLLGRPDRVGGRSHVYVYSVGLVNDYAGPGDEGSLHVAFDGTWSRVIAADIPAAGSIRLRGGS